MSDYFNKEQRKEAISASLTRKLKAAGLHDYVKKAVNHAHSRFEGGVSAFRAIQDGVRFAHELEVDEHEQNPGIG